MLAEIIRICICKSETIARTEIKSQSKRHVAYTVAHTDVTVHTKLSADVIRICVINY